MHAAHPFISVWDDHEVEDNHADGKPELGPAGPEQDQPQGPTRAASRTSQRRANGYKAFFSYMPRHPLQGRPEPHLRGLPPRQERGPGPHRRAPVPRPAAVQRRDPRGPAPTPTTPRDPARRARRRTGSCAPEGLAGHVEGLGHPADADEPARRPATGQSAAQVDAWDGYAYERKADPRLHPRQRDPGRGRASPATSTRSSPARPTPRGDEDARLAPALPGVRRRLGDLDAASPRRPASRTPLLDVLAGVQPPHRLLRLPQARATACVEATASELTCELKAANAKIAGQPSATARQVPGRSPASPIPQRIDLADRGLASRPVRYGSRAWTSRSPTSRATSSPRSATSASASAAPRSSARS